MSNKIPDQTGGGEVIPHFIQKGGYWILGPSGTHSPGPWRQSTDNVHAIVDSTGMVVADSVLPRDKPIVIAAPKMLHALNELLTFDTGTQSWVEASKRAAELVSQVEGWANEPHPGLAK